MRKLKHWLLAVAIPLFLVGCVTVEDLQSANRLIHADDQLQTLVQAQPEDINQAVSVELIALGNDAMKQAKLLAGNEATQREAVSYYRIAATAFWQSRSDSAASQLFEARDDGLALCEDLKPNAPDRDRLFLKLIIPYAVLETSMHDADKALDIVQGEIESNDLTSKSVDALEDAYGNLKTAKSAIKEIESLEQDPALKEHEEFNAYYQYNKADINDNFLMHRGRLAGRLSQFLQMSSPNPVGSDGEPLGITSGDVGDLQL